MRPATTLHERILAHLREHPFDPQAASAPRQVTQEGIAEAVGVRVAHVSRALRVLGARGLIEIHTGRIAGGRRKTRTHALSVQGRESARGLVLVEAHPPPRPTPAGEPAPLRPEVLDHLVQALETAMREGPRRVLVEGDAGSGKSRLLAEFREAGSRAGLRWAVGRAAPLGAEQSLGPLQQALAALDLEAHYREAPPGTPLERARAAAAAALAGAAPVALVLDDLHLAGASAVEFLHGVMRLLPDDAPVLLVAAFRREEAWELPNGPLYTALMPLAAPPRGSLVTLHPLDEEAVARLLARHGHELDAHLVERVTQESGGIPSYALAMAELFEDGVDESDFFPPVVQSHVRERFAALPADALALLQTAAMCGAEFDVDVLARAHDASIDELSEPLELLLDRLLLEEVASPRGARLRFEHPKVREAALRDMRLARRRVVSERVARALAAAQPEGPADHGAALR